MHRVGVLAALLVALTGCSRLDFKDSFDINEYRLPFAERLRKEAAAPIIVVARVVRIEEIGRPMRSPGDPRVQTQLAQIAADVETVIKGEVRSNRVNFYYFTYSQRNRLDLGVSRYIPHVGQRRIYFLKPWRNDYRSIGDATDYTLPVSGGTYNGAFCRGRSPGCCIAKILLQPMPDVDTRWFVAHLVQAEYAAEILCCQSMARELMHKLTENPDARISAAARKVVAGTLSRPHSAP